MRTTVQQYILLSTTVLVSSVFDDCRMHIVVGRAKLEDSTQLDRLEILKCSVFQALAMFWYLDNRNDKWKTSGIKDEDVFEVALSPCGGGHDETIRWAAAVNSFKTMLCDSAHFHAIQMECLDQDSYDVRRLPTYPRLPIDRNCVFRLLLLNIVHR